MKMLMMRTIGVHRPLPRFVYFLCLLSFFGVTIFSDVASANSLDDMIPDDNQDTLYNEFGPSHYAFQTVTPERPFWQINGKVDDTITAAYDTVLSTIFVGGVQITRFFNFISREAFTFSFMNSLIDGVEEIVQGLTGVSGGDLGTGMWGTVFGLFASITLLYMLWQFARLKFFETAQTALSFLIALLCAFAFFSNIGPFLKFVNDTGNEVASLMYKGLAIPGGLHSSETEGVKQISEQVWMELVMRPYGMLQFDDGNVYETHPSIVRDVLETDPFSPEREEALKDAADTFPAVERIRSAEQMILLICNAVFAVIVLGLLSFWGIATIFFRLKLLIHTIVMSVTLLASLLPGREAGLSVIRSQFLKFIGLGMMTVFTMFFLNLSLVAGHLMFKIVYTSGAGWFTAMLMEAIMIFVIFKYRSEIGSVFSKAAGHIPMAPRVKSTVLDAFQRNVTRTVYEKTVGAVGGMLKHKEVEGVPSTWNPNSISKSNDNLNDGTAASMQLRYQREKEAAEQHAKETGQTVQYTPFVQKVNENLRNNAKNPFRGMDKEWKEEKSRLKGIKDDGGDVKTAILSQGVTNDMNDQQVAATIYANENAIRQSSKFMVNRPKKAVEQMQRAGTLNKNRRLENSVNDFVMVELFTRYKVEYKQAIDKAAATGEPVQHTEFVKNMDERFKSAGMNTTQKINEYMLTRSGRLAVSPHFESLSEFGQKKEGLLRANEAFRKATAPTEGLPESAPVNVSGPVNPASVVKSMPPLPTAASVPSPTMERDMTILLKTKPSVESVVDMSKVNLPGDLKDKINEAKAKLKEGAQLDSGDRLEINTETKVEIFTTLKQRVSREISNDLGGLNNELKIMQKANGRNLTTADVNDKNNVIHKNASQKAQSARNNTPKQKKRPKV